jgi:hypothetical protein
VSNTARGLDALHNQHGGGGRGNLPLAVWNLRVEQRAAFRTGASLAATAASVVEMGDTDDDDDDDDGCDGGSQTWARMPAGSRAWRQKRRLRRATVMVAATAACAR